MSGQRKDRTFLTPLISWDMVNELRQAQYSWDEIAEMVKTKTFACSGKQLRSLCANRKKQAARSRPEWGGTRTDPLNSKNWRSYQHPHDWCG